ncbi:MAG: DEAD/DEAH box helicase, partial [Deltaproteobacteria bacterium]|nr:DEAD/DEAH box helicase [Deltaproteobacteria bacterium]
MDKNRKIKEYIESLVASKSMKHQVAFHKFLRGRSGHWKSTERSLPRKLIKMLQTRGIERLYSHQAEAIDNIRSCSHTVVATPTASGKTFIYNLPVIEKICNNQNARALYIFPLKALAQDQLKNFREIAAYFKEKGPTAAIYDGDTSSWNRKKIRLSPPNVLFSNPEMVHLAILPHHEKWREFLSGLQIIVIDEVHTYRGIMGSHMAQVFRRLIRVCNHYGSKPTFVFSSATIANPSELAGQLTGLQVDVVENNGAPQGNRHVVLLNPDTGPAQAAILLLKAALHRGLRTIVYTQSRKLTELIAIWAGSRSGRFRDKISAYRAGFLPEERREIEARLSSGELLAVISTSALELGIDIGDLDLCILVGYPGSIMATWQRGGRVGRSGQESALVLIAGEDALDQYFIRNPREFMNKEPEAAVINPYNLEILKKHLTCAASESPLKIDEPFMRDKSVKKAALSLELQGDLLRSGDGKMFFSRLKMPHRHVDLRGTGSRFNIECSETGENKGEIDGFRAFRETHPGAIYLHRGDTFLVKHLNLSEMTVKVSPVNPNYYTRVRGNKNTEILEVLGEKSIWGTRVFKGRLKVTDQVTGYEKWQIHSRKRLNVIPIDLPPQVFETEGFWVTIPNRIQEDVISKYLHFMGGIHAIEHAMIGVVPFFVMADRNDLGGISIPLHPQINHAAVFIYDGIPGGAGLSMLAYQRAEDLFERTLEIIKKCPCDSGCPSCVHSPKCGSGNRPIDKASAYYILNRLRSDRSTITKENRSHVRMKKKRIVPVQKQKKRIRFGVLDIETKRSAQEVGGWHKADKMGISCAVLYDSESDDYFEFMDDRIPNLIQHLCELDLVIGFNIKRFDYLVLSGYSDFDFSRLNTLDILEKIHERLGYRLSLNHLTNATLGIQKSADGLQ